jgi:hypothetical protein
VPRKHFILPADCPVWWARRTETGQWVVTGCDGREVIRHGSELDRCRAAYLQKAAPILRDMLICSATWLERVAVQGAWVDPELLWHDWLAVRGSRPPQELEHQLSGRRDQQEVTFGEVA